MFHIYYYVSQKAPREWFNISHLTNIGNPIVEIRRSYDRLISTMGFPILVYWIKSQVSYCWQHMLVVTSCSCLWVICGHWHNQTSYGQCSATAGQPHMRQHWWYVVLSCYHICSFNFDALAQGNPYKHTKDQIHYHRPSGIKLTTSRLRLHR